MPSVTLSLQQLRCAIAALDQALSLEKLTEDEAREVRSVIGAMGVFVSDCAAKKTTLVAVRAEDVR